MTIIAAIDGVGAKHEHDVNTASMSVGLIPVFSNRSRQTSNMMTLVSSSASCRPARPSCTPLAASPIAPPAAPPAMLTQVDLPPSVRIAMMPGLIAVAGPSPLRSQMRRMKTEASSSKRSESSIVCMTVSESTNQSSGGLQQLKSRRKTRGPRRSGGSSAGKSERSALVGAVDESSVPRPDSEVVCAQERAAARRTARAAASGAARAEKVSEEGARAAAREAARAAAARTAARRARPAEAATGGVSKKEFCKCLRVSICFLPFTAIAFEERLASHARRGRTEGRRRRGEGREEREERMKLERRQPRSRGWKNSPHGALSPTTAS